MGMSDDFWTGLINGLALSVPLWAIILAPVVWWWLA